MNAACLIPDRFSCGLENLSGKVGTPVHGNYLRQSDKESGSIEFLDNFCPKCDVSVIRELKEQRGRRLRKRHLKNEFTLLQTLSRLFRLVQFVKCWHIFLVLNVKRLYQSSGKEKESRCLVFTSSTKPEIRHFHVVVV